MGRVQDRCSKAAHLNFIDSKRERGAEREIVGMGGERYPRRSRKGRGALKTRTPWNRVGPGRLQQGPADRREGVLLRIKVSTKISRKKLARRGVAAKGTCAREGGKRAGGRQIGSDGEKGGKKVVECLSAG